MKHSQTPPTHGFVAETGQAAQSSRRQRRHRLDPRLDDISGAVRSGSLSLEEGLHQAAKVLGEVAGRVLEPEERLALEYVMRDEIAAMLKRHTR